MIKVNIRIFYYLLIIALFAPLDTLAEQRDITDSFETYTFKREIRLAPGEFYAVTYNDDRAEFIETEPDRCYKGLPDRALRQILRSPLWLREKFADSLVDLYYDEIDVGDDAYPAFMDVNGDELVDLIVSNADGEFRCFIAPYYKENQDFEISDIETLAVANGLGFSLTGAEDGSITVITNREIDTQLIENLNRIKVEGNSKPVFEDITGDGLPDLLIGSSDGTISVYENYGTNEKWWFVSFNTQTDRKFDDDIGYLSSPRIGDVDGDGINDIVSGSKDALGLIIYYGPDYTETRGFIYEPGFEPGIDGAFAPALGDFNGDRIIDHAIGFENGTIQIFITDENGVAHAGEEYSGALSVPGFATPCSGDFDDDGICDLVVGSGDGKLHFFKGTGNGFEKIDGFFDELDVGNYPSPAAYDFNDDTMIDLIVGNQAGEIRVFLSPDWSEVDRGLGLVGAGNFTSPAFGDLTGDNKPELLIGSVDGTFRYYEGQGSAWFERYSWEFHPMIHLGELEGYLERTHPEATLFRGMIDDDAVDAFLDVFDKCGDDYFDEVVFAFANTSTEMLRTMTRLENADLLFENARAIYDFASRVKYANILEKEDYTTIEYISDDGTFHEMPRDIYYWWVVHPVVQYEIPSRVDASYWRHNAEYYGITEQEWNRKEITADEYEHTASAYFWRTFLPIDRRYGKNLLDIVEPAETIEEAVYLIADWITFSGSKPGRWNEYGRESSDLQPLVIYEKNYGSCGEQAIFCAACSRTALIPNAPVGCHGEDHIWNEWWMDGHWYKWDTGQSVSSLGHPWNEGRGHTRTPLLSIVRHRGDGLTDNSTTRPINPPGSNYITGNAPGYSEVGRVKIRVVDEIDEPVEGALVVIRSKWNNYHLASIWDFTDPEGFCDFELGEPATGSCVVDIITPLGVTGTEYFIVRENEEFEYTYTLPGRFNRQGFDTAAREQTYSGPDSLGVCISIIEEEQRPLNFYTGRRSDLESAELYESTGYHGNRWYSEPNSSSYGICSTVLSASEYKIFLTTHELPRSNWTEDSNYYEPFTPDTGEVIFFYNPNRYTHVRFDVALMPNMSSENPVIELESPPTSAGTGEQISFAGRASDNLHVATLKISFNGGLDFTDITEYYDRGTGEFTYTWDTGAGGPMPAGEYPLVLRIEDDSLNFHETNVIDFTLEMSRDFIDQVIYQDDPDSPLPISSWILGPFVVGENERFLGVQCESIEQGFDADMFLFHDGNGNRRLDGMHEQIASSTSPSAVETILYNDPQPGAYWIFCQGWLVKDRTGIDIWQEIRNLPMGKFLTLEPMNADRMVTYALLDVSLSFDYSPAFIIDINPVNELSINDPVITGNFKDGFNVDPDTIKVFFADEDISESALVNADGFTISLNDITLLESTEYSLQIEAGTTNGLYDNLELTLTATVPEPAKIDHAITHDAENLSVDIELIEEYAVLEMARARVDYHPWFNLDLSDELTSASGEIPLTDVGNGEHNLTVEYRIIDGDLESREFTFEYNPNIQQRLINLIPGDGAQVYDHCSVLIAYYSLEIKDDVASVRMFLDNDEITDSAIVYSDGIIYLPTESYTKGDHTFRVLVTLHDGRIIEGVATFTILSMDEAEKGTVANGAFKSIF